MKNTFFYKKTIYFILLVWFSSFSCTNNNPKNELKDSTATEKQLEEISSLSLTLSNIKYVLGNEMEFEVSEKDTSQFDSMVFFLDNKKIGQTIQTRFTVKHILNNSKVGNCILKIESYHKKKKTEISKNFDVLSDIIPENLTFKVVKTYPHDETAYTQGLFWYKGFLYESTGLKGSSSLRKVDLKTGAVVQNHIIRDDYFCEGITLYNDKIIQLTWRSNEGFVYNLKTFELLQKFNYPREGWGITTVGDSLVMSDGTATLYYLNPQTFVETSRIEVYNNKEAISYLNELEYINGEIWANIYGKKSIVRIDPKTGKVLKQIDFNSLPDKQDLHRNIDVFNGIAFDAENNKIFVTGKNWNKIYEIAVQKK